jgi:23S rRNA (cytosine1962-C5)-methyltransferase
MATVRRSGVRVQEEVVTISLRGVDRLRSGHLWVYRSDVAAAAAEPGAVVRLQDERGRFQGRAFYSDKSQIAVRLLTREDVAVDRAFFAARLEQADAYRRLVVENSDAYRVVYSEGDLLPSLIVDRYGDYLVLQTLSQATDRLKSLLEAIS